MNEKNIKSMDIYNFDATSTIPPLPEEPIARDGYKWVKEEGRWIIDPSQSQTKRFEIMIASGRTDMISSLFKERQLDGYAQRLEERKMAQKKE